MDKSRGFIMNIYLSTDLYMNIESNMMGCTSGNAGTLTTNSCCQELLCRGKPNLNFNDGLA